VTVFAAGALPDAARQPDGATRGSVVILGGLDETPDDFALLTEVLLLAGYAVTIFGDVSVDPRASAEGVARLLENTIARPVIVVGTDFGAVLALSVAVESASTAARVDAVVIGGLVTRASRASTSPIADLEAVTTSATVAGAVAGAFTASGGAADLLREPRIPHGFRLPDAPRVRLPTLVLHGDADDVTAVADAVSWASLLPFGSLRLVPGGDHHVLVGEERRTIAASILLFIERQRAGRAVLVDGFASTSSRAR
jgi:alpha-beta hydrolase superfamily lysophospholipase